MNPRANIQLCSYHVDFKLQKRKSAYTIKEIGESISIPRSSSVTEPFIDIVQMPHALM